MIRVISLGAGVQSSAMFLMACKGELTPKPDAAIFADTQKDDQEQWADVVGFDNEIRNCGGMRGTVYLRFDLWWARRTGWDAAPAELDNVEVKSEE